MLVRSPAFLHEGTIPRKYTCDGDNLSPPLAIDRAPLKTATFALIVEDPDAPGGWDHWVVCNIPGTTSRLGEGTDPIGTEGLNSWGTIGYGGPCPPEGEHRYLFRVYALDTWLRIPVRYPRALLSELMRGHVLECTTLMGRYARTSDAERAAALCHYS
jgi:Raf kinase inhibitor-like YbhB/YbcL family protein